MDFVNVLRALFKRKWMVIGGIAVVVIIAFLLASLLPKEYNSNGFLQFSDPSKENEDMFYSVASQLLESSSLAVYAQLKDQGLMDIFKSFQIDKIEPPQFHVMTTQKFKKYAPSFRNLSGFVTFCKENKYFDEEELESFKALYSGRHQFSKTSREVFALSPIDLKNLAAIRQQAENYVVGVKLNIRAHERNLAQKYGNALGHYIRFSIFNARIDEYVDFQLNEATTLVDRYENYILKNQGLLEGLKNKQMSLQTIYKKFPNFSRFDNRQLSNRIVAVETRIQDLEQMIAGFKQDKKQSALLKDFFLLLKTKLTLPRINGKKVFELWTAAVAGYFKDMNTGNPEVRWARNSINIDKNRFHTYYNKTLHMVSAPSLPGGPSWPRRSYFLILGLFIGIIFFVVLVLLLEFWEKHRGMIIKK
jgi:LPS O-antigen subunit length determinant protein (WzzB/FepE family)